jgi:hypothetical protein
MKLATYLLLIDSASSLRFINNINDLQDESTGAMPDKMPEPSFRKSGLMQIGNNKEKIEVLKNAEEIPGVESTTTVERDVKAENLPPVPNLQGDVWAITRQIPVLEGLKARIPVLNSMEPELKDVNR